MSSLRDAIVATLTYHDIFDYPLTSFEVWQQIISPNKISLAEVLFGLDKLVGQNSISQHNGFYFLKSKTADICEQRINRQKISAQKWKKLRRLAWWFQVAPFIRGMFVSGSLTMDNTKDDADFDIFIIAQAGRLYTVRIYVLMIAWLFRSLRVKTDKRAPNKFCFNHYITTAQLKLPNESIYTAHTLTTLVPIMVRHSIDSDLWRHNRWINKFFANFIPPAKSNLIPESKILNLIRKFREILLNTRLGDWLERRLKSFQQKRIWNNPPQYRQAGRIVASDTQLEFHPHTFEIKVLKTYNSILNSGA